MSSPSRNLPAGPRSARYHIPLGRAWYHHMPRIQCQEYTCPSVISLNSRHVPGLPVRDPWRSLLAPYATSVPDIA
eukprot:2266677-Rhodomonas_salina.16